MGAHYQSSHKPGPVPGEIRKAERRLPGGQRPPTGVWPAVCKCANVHLVVHVMGKHAEHAAHCHWLDLGMLSCSSSVKLMSLATPNKKLILMRLKSVKQGQVIFWSFDDI